MTESRNPQRRLLAAGGWRNAPGELYSAHETNEPDRRARAEGDKLVALRISLFLHVMAAIYWVGESLFDVLVLGPVIRSCAGRPWLNELLERLRPRLRWSSWSALALLIATGCTNLWLLHVPTSIPALLASAFGRVLIVKLAAVALLLVLALIHGLVQIPELRRLRLLAAAGAGAGAEAERALAAYRRGRQRAAWVGRSTVALAVLIVFLGVWLVTGPR